MVYIGLIAALVFLSFKSEAIITRLSFNTGRGTLAKDVMLPHGGGTLGLEVLGSEFQQRAGTRGRRSRLLTDTSSE